VNQLRKEKFDLVILYHTKKRTNLLCFIAGIPMRIGYKNNKFGFLLTDPIEDERHLGQKHETQYCLDLLTHLGIESKDDELNVSVTNESEVWVEQFIKENNIQEQDILITIHAGASDPSKRWPEKSFAELISILQNRNHCKIVLVGSVDTTDVSQKIVSLLAQPVLDMTGKTSLSRSVSLIKRSNLLISNDSGPVHIAAALNVPVIAIFTRNQPGINLERWKPLGEKSRVISVSPDDTLSFEKAKKIDPKYLELIPTERVLEEVDSIFKVC